MMKEKNFNGHNWFNKLISRGANYSIKFAQTIPDCVGFPSLILGLPADYPLTTIVGGIDQGVTSWQEWKNLALKVALKVLRGGKINGATPPPPTTTFIS